MIDYIKAYFPNRNTILQTMKEYYHLDKISYKRFDKIKNENTLYETYKKDFYNMELKITNKEAYIHNSIHHFYNKMVYDIDGNYNDFTFPSLVQSIRFLEDQIKYESNQLLLSQSLEFGLNLEAPFNIDQFILEECILYDFKQASKSPPPTEELVYKEFEKGNFRLKIYHKGRHQLNGENILRIEIKFMDKREFNHLGIYTVHDLTNKDNLILLYNKLYNIVTKKLMCVDNIEERNFSSYKKNKLYKYCSQKYWDELSKENFKNRSGKVYSYLDKSNLLEHKKTLLTLMDNKFTELLEI
ncbi:hypothetical protein CMU11_00875 [Elizabethkingia anophelis]|uniref:hypothetical protein n=2 Tax=Elizabethkingia miricola TaxID=172045 RepID=UPI0009CE777E|nr:hypothetical protein [Elizabethkingia miricola]MDV3567849.1 hypothetical protein [Elizabethkingia anophelis]MDV3633950.1 hypothetical protein [Elizabethkingia anophelis]MDV3708803.1 hypothetical protein [Elizabethkingia anophelis]MDV3732278.1 hypothetical protein [Elizabethkingia anophelis]MDV3735657.1 hypothetical protein [Elizabethkingia anophelis]